MMPLARRPWMRHNAHVLADSDEEHVVTDTAYEIVFARAESALERILERWWQAPTTVPFDLPRYSLQERFARERHLERLVEQLCVEATTPPRSVASRLALRQRLQSGVTSFCHSGLGWSNRQIALLFDGGLVEVGLAFARQARAFDPQISNAAIFQASRNVWIMNGLQRLLGLPVALTPSILAYSLLYPYTDNYLDDPEVEIEQKAAFSARFALCLAGSAPQPANVHEEHIWALVAMIEGQYARETWPQVFASLQLIHKAQTDSIILLHEHVSPYQVDVLRLSLAKGGASVLADGYLVAGDLTAAQVQALYGYGALLQLADDMQDVTEDIVADPDDGFFSDGRDLAHGGHRQSRHESGVGAAR